MALPVAIETLRRYLHLPPPLCVVSGEIDEDGRIQPIDKERPAHVRAKLDAVLDEGSLPRLVTVTRQEHDLRGLDAIVASNASLYQIASKIWGEYFSHRWEKAVNDRLQGIGVASAWRETDLPKRDDLFVKTAKADEMERLILNADGPEVFSVGGPAWSGKSWLAQDVERRLHDCGWQTHVFDCSGTTVSVKDLTEGLTGIIENLMQPAEHRLIVLDGLRYERQRERLTLDFGDLATKLRAHVLVERQTDYSSEGDEPGGTEVSSIVSSDDRHEFIRELAAQYPDVLAKRGLTAEEFRNQYAGTGTSDPEAPQRGLPHDLFWICQTAQYGRDTEGYHRFLMDPVADNEKEQLKLLAYATRYGIGCESQLVAGLGPETRIRFRVVENANDVAWIDQPLNAQMALWDPDNTAKSLEFLEEELGAGSILPILKHVILPPDGPLSQKPDFRVERLGFIIRHLSQKWPHTVRLTFFGEDGDRIPPLLCPKSKETEALLAEDFSGTPWHAAQLVLDVGPSLPEPERLVLLHNMIIQMSREARAKHPRFTCSQLAACYSAVFENMSHLRDASAKNFSGGKGDLHAAVFTKKREIQTTWDAFLKESRRSALVRRVCEQELEPRDRLKLFEGMVKLDDMAVLSEAREIMPTLKTNMSKMGGNKYRYLIDLRSSIADFHSVLATLEVGQCAGDSHSKVTDEHESIQKDIDQICRNEGNLVRYRKTDLTCLVDFRDWARLTLAVGCFNPKENDEDAEFFAEMFDSLAKTESLGTIINSIDAIHAEQKPAAICLIKNSKLFHKDYNLHPWRGANLTDFSKLLSTMKNWDPEMLKSHLFLRADPQRAEPNRALTSALAERVKEEGDLRNFEKILRVSGDCDLSVIGKASEGFAAALLEKTSPKWLVDRIRGETRAEILCDLFEGLAHLDEWQYELRHALVEQLGETMANRQFSKWGARLYKKLLADESTGPAFSESLLDLGKFNDADLVDGMRSAQDVEACEEYHIIGRMRPEIGGKFVAENPPDQFGPFIEERLFGQKVARPVLRIIRAVTKTYRQFDPNMANAFVNDLDWDCLRAALQHDTPSAFGHLAELSSDRATEVIRSDEGQKILDSKLRGSVGKPGHFAEILFNCEKNFPGEGRRLRKRMSTEHLQIVETKLNAEENPRTYAASVNKLAEVWPEAANRATTSIERWMPKLNRMTSPEALYQVLLLCQRADSSVLLQVAETVEVDRVAKRLKTRPELTNLRAAPKLAILLAHSKQEGSGRIIAEAMAEVMALESRLDASDFHSLLKMYEALEQVPPEDMTDQLEARLIKKGMHKWHVDPVAFWRGFGTYALERQKIRGVKIRLFCTEPPTLARQVDPTTRVLALSAHDETDWGAMLLSAAWQEISSRPSVVPSEWTNIVRALCPNPDIQARLEEIASSRSGSRSSAPPSLPSSTNELTSFSN